MAIKAANAAIDIPQDDLDERAARESGPVIHTTMTPEDIKNYGPPQSKTCTLCGRKRPIAEFKYLKYLHRYSDRCMECRAKELQARII